ncbi:MAG: sulfurtransferase [Burkholderiales bacterium]|nr:sulfurtransferase [Burkholderiales bacterium]MDE2297856.1 sulfurtransferase [Burkholderiales bacterium]MDE2627543.1 sulfurtransferase [Burkholderiales bacterium]
MKQLSGRELLAEHAGGAARPLLLDVREPWEVALAAIRIDGCNTLHIPMNSIPARLGEIDAAQPVVCICHHGVRSAQVVAFLERQGFEAVYNLAGGIDAWSQQVDAGVPRY